MAMDHEPMPAFLDEDGQELWKMCDWVIMNRSSSASVALAMQALAIRRELRSESQLTKLRAACIAVLRAAEIGDTDVFDGDDDEAVYDNAEWFTLGLVKQLRAAIA